MITCYLLNMFQLSSFFLSLSALHRHDQNCPKSDVEWCRLSNQEERGIIMGHLISDWICCRSLCQEQMRSSVMPFVAVQKLVSIRMDLTVDCRWCPFVFFLRIFFRLPRFPLQRELSELSGQTFRTFQLFEFEKSVKSQDNFQFNFNCSILN